MVWLAYGAAWVAFAIFWTLASASSAGMSPLETFPYGLLAMGSAATMGLGIWRVSGRIPWDWRSRAFYLVHAAGLAIFSVVYAHSWLLPDVVTGRFAAAIAESLKSSVLIWNLLMGSWLYLVVAGIAYTIRANRRVRAQEAATAEAQLLAQRAQLVALRSQINPHFLFNALHSVGALVSIDPARADRALESLGDLLRYALGTEDEVLFAEEWRFTQDYLAFEQLRLGDRLKIDAHADAEVLAVMVPPLIYQPLVENAVRHGIAERPEGGHITLRALVEDARLVLRVTDDGPGDCGNGGDGIGRKSVGRRLAALYGDRASLTIDRRASGFTVTIGLPMPAEAVGAS
jgi:sensor histidine kinase YesM